MLSIINERKSFFLSLVSSLFITTEITSDFIFCLSNSFNIEHSKFDNFTILS